MTDYDAFVVEAELPLRDGLDPAAVGAAVTIELCGHWEHEGPCRWPHNSAIETERDPVRFRTLFVADKREAELVRLPNLPGERRAGRGETPPLVRKRGASRVAPPERTRLAIEELSIDPDAASRQRLG